MLRRIIWLLPALLAVPAATAEDKPEPRRGHDWPQFRGPPGQGHAHEKLVTEWSDTKNVLWKVDVAQGWVRLPSPALVSDTRNVLWKVDVAAGWSSPVVVGGKIYLTCAVPIKDSKNQSLRALCLNARD